ncbi:MAG: DNA recombination protein RmuC [Patescibacteria group bacterium]
MTVELTLIIILGIALAVAVGYIFARRKPNTGDQAMDSTLELIVGAVNKIQGEQRASQEVQRGLKDELRQTADKLKDLTVTTVERDKKDQVYFQNLFSATKNIESVLRGSKSKGMAGENIIRELLKMFPQSMMVYDFKLGSKVVEFGIKLPDGRILPLDSKVVANEELAKLEETDDEEIRLKLITKIEQAVLRKAKEVSEYISPPITYERAIMAVPDAVHYLLKDSQFKAWRDYGVMILPYGLTVPYLLSFLDLQRKHSTHLDEERVKSFLEDLVLSLSKLDDILDNKIAKSNVMIGNAYSDSKQILTKIKSESTSLAASRVEKQLVASNGGEK